MKPMHAWPMWQRWAMLAAGWSAYALGFWWLLTPGAVFVRVVALLVVCAGLAVAEYASKAVRNERMRAVDRRACRLMLPAMAAYVALVLFVWPLQARLVAMWARTAVALLPVLPILVVVWGMARYLNRCDELERRQQLEAAALAAAAVGVASMAIGFLGAAALVRVDGALAMLLVFPALCAVYGCSNGWTKWRSRAR